MPAEIPPVNHPPASAPGPAPKKESATPAQSFWRLLTKFDSSKMSAYRALRNAAGVVLPLIGGFALGMPRGGLVVASSALNVAFSDGSDPYARRAKRMISSSVLCAIGVTAGGLAEPHAALAIIVATLWAFAAGMFVALGTTAADLSSISLVTLLVYAAYPLTPHQALISGVLALGGGLLQTALSVALWPMRRYEPERRALADFFSALARTAETPLTATAAPAASHESDQAQQALSSLDGEDNIDAVRYRALMNQAERIRLSLLMLARLRLRMERESHAHAAVKIVDRALGHAAVALRAIRDLLTTETATDSGADSSVEIPELSKKLAKEPA